RRGGCQPALRAPQLRRAAAALLLLLYAEPCAACRSLPAVSLPRSAWFSFVGESLYRFGVGRGSAIFRAFLLIVGHNARNSGHEIALVEIDELDPLRDTSRYPHLRHRATDDHTMFCDDHDLVGWQNLHQGNDIACFLGSVHRDDALSATFLNPVIGDVGALAEAALGDDEKRCVTLDDDHSDNGISFA